MVPEAPLEKTGDGLVPVGAGWFVLNARDARWSERPGRRSVSFTGKTEWESDALFPMLGVNLAVLEPGQANSIYHWETETEAFLVLSGEALLIVEGEERPLRQWDFVHCPPKTEHVVVGAGEGPCVLLAMSSRERQAFGPYGEYVANEVAAATARRRPRRRRTTTSPTRACRARGRRATATTGCPARRRDASGTPRPPPRGRRPAPGSPAPRGRARRGRRTARP